MNTLFIVFNQSGLLWRRLFSGWSVAYALLVAYKHIIITAGGLQKYVYCFGNTLFVADL